VKTLLILAFALLVLAACSPSPRCSREHVFCVGLVTDRAGIEDHGLNQEAWFTLGDLLADRTIQHVAFIESVDPRDYEKNIAYFTSRGYDLVITVGAAQRQETLAAADLNRDVVFLGLDQTQEQPRPNLRAITFPEDQLGFVAGSLAALMTETRVVGAVCETSSIDSVWRQCEGFRKGVAHVDDAISVFISYRDDLSDEKLFADTDWGYDAAARLIRRGADVILGVGGGTGQGALLAAADEGVYAIGAERDQWYALAQARPVLITSVYAGNGASLRVWVQALAGAGNIPDDTVGSIMIAPFHDLDTRISNDIRRALADILQGLQGGGIQTGVPAAAP